MRAFSPVALLLLEFRLLRLELRFCELFMLPLVFAFWLEFWPLSLSPARPAIANTPKATTSTKAQMCADFINCWLLIRYRPCQFNLLTHPAAAAYAQAHQPGGENAKIFYFPRVAIAQTHARCWNQHALIFAAADVNLRVAEWIHR